MSGLIYPSLPGLTYNTIRAPMFKTGVQTALSGKETTIAYQLYPRTRFTLIYSALRDTGQATLPLGPSEIQTLVGFFTQMMGRYDTFLFTDPEFNSAVAEPFGVGGGGVTLFPVTAAYDADNGPGALELIQNFVQPPNFYNNGALINPNSYTLGPTPTINAGYIQFNVAPGPGAVLTWSGNFYYRCRFDEDTYDWTKMMNLLWELKKLSFTSVLQ